MTDWSADAVIDRILSANHLPSRTAFIAVAVALLVYLQWQAILVILLAGFLATSDQFSIAVKTLLQDEIPVTLLDTEEDPKEARELAIKSLPPLSSRSTLNNSGKLDVLPELYEPLDTTLDLVIRDFVDWWYIPLALNPPDYTFPRECRKSINYVTSSICQRVVDGRSGTDIAIFLFCSTAQTLLRGLRTRRMPSHNGAEGKSDTVEAKEEQDYHPLLRNTAAQILSLSSSPTDAENAALQALLTEIIAGQIEAVVSILTPDWVNRTVIAFFEDEKKEQRVREEAERMRKKVEQVVNADTIPGEYKEGGEEESEEAHAEGKDEEDGKHEEKESTAIPANNDKENVENANETKKSENDSIHSNAANATHNPPKSQQRPRRETHHGQKPSIYIPQKETPAKAVDVPTEEEDLGVTNSDKKASVVSPFSKPFHEAVGDIGVKDDKNKDSKDTTPTLRDVLAHRNDSDVYDDFERFLEMRRREGLLRLLTQVTTFKEIVTITSPSESIFRQDAIALLARAEEAVLPGDVSLLESIKTTRLKIDVDASLNAFLPIEVEIYTNLENEYATFTHIKRDSGSVSSTASLDLSGGSQSMSMSQSTNASDVSTARTSIEPRQSRDCGPSYYERQTKVDVTDVSQTPSQNAFVNGKTLELMIAIEEEGLPGWMLFRRWVEFEKLDNALQKTFPNAGTAEFPRAYLPSLKFKKSSDICALLGAYIKTLLIDPRYSESALVTNFLKKEQTGAEGKSRGSKLFDLTQPGKTFTEFAQAVSDIGVNKKRLSFPGPLKAGKGVVQTSAQPQNENEMASATAGTGRARSTDTINEVDMRTPSEEPDYSAYASVEGRSEDEGEQSGQSEQERESVDSVDSDDVMPVESSPTQTDQLAPSTPAEEGMNGTPTPATPVTPTTPTTPSRTVSNINDEDLNLVLNSIFSILEEAYQLSGQQWSLRRGFFRVLERVIRTSYSGTVRTALQSLVEGVTEVRNVSQVLCSLRDALWPPPQREWATSEADGRTEEQKKETAATAKRLLVQNKPRALSGAMGDNATRDAVILLHELFQDEQFCREIATLLALDLLRVCL